METYFEKLQILHSLEKRHLRSCRVSGDLVVVALSQWALFFRGVPVCPCPVENLSTEYNADFLRIKKTVRARFL